MPREYFKEESFPSDEEFDDEEESDSSTDVDAKLAEDDVFDVEFLKCYSALKKKDNKIYDKNVKFFTEPEDGDDKAGDQDNADVGDGEQSGPKKKSIAPKMTLLDLQLQPGREEENDELDQPKIDLNQQVTKSYYEKELEEIKRSIEKVGEEIDSESDDDLLVVKNSDGKEGAKKQRNKIKSILDKIENEDDEDIEHLKQVWTNPDSLTDEDRYLRDYILNKRYLQASADDDDDDGGKGGFFSKNLEGLSDAETEDDVADKSKGSSSMHRSEEKDFDKLARIPRNSTKTIRDMVEKQEKKEKRMKKLEKEKKRKKTLKDADCEDVVGDLPTRFHYRETEPNDYGLTAEELLMATDEELDQWVSLHECVAYKSREEEIAQKKRFDSKRDDMELKRKIFKSIYSQDEDVQQPSDQSKSKKNRKRKRKRNTDSESSAVEVVNQPVKPEKSSGDSMSNKQKNKKLRRRGIKNKKFASVGVAPDRLLAYGLSKTKLKKGKLL